MSKVYIVPAQYLQMLQNVIGKTGTKLNLSVVDFFGNTVIGEEWDSEEFSEIRQQIELEYLEFEPKPIIDKFKRK